MSASKTERRLISQPAHWWAAFEAAAAAEGIPLSEWIGAKCKAGLSKAKQKELGERPLRGRPFNRSGDNVG